MRDGSSGACHRDDLILAWFSSPTRTWHVSASGQEAVEALHAAQAPFSLVRSCVFRGWPSAGPLLPTYSPDHGWLPGGHALASRPNGWGALGSAAYLVVSEWMLPLLPRAGAGARRLCGDGGAAAWGWCVSGRARFPVWSTKARGSAACSQRAQPSAPVMAEPDPGQPPEVKWQLRRSCDRAVGGNETAFRAATCECAGDNNPPEPAPLG